VGDQDQQSPQNDALDPALGAALGAARAADPAAQTGPASVATSKSVAMTRGQVRSAGPAPLGRRWHVLFMTAFFGYGGLE
jgi:hypothetical protein